MVFSTRWMRRIVLFSTVLSVALPLCGEGSDAASALPEISVVTQGAELSQLKLDSAEQGVEESKPQDGALCPYAEVEDQSIPLASCQPWPHIACKNQAECEGVCQPGDGYCTPASHCCIC